MLSGCIWIIFVALHHHELEISGQAPLKLPYFKGLYKKNGWIRTLQLRANEPENTKLFVCKRWDVQTRQFFRYLKVEKSLNPLCFTVSFSQRAASPCNSKIACFVKKLLLHIYTKIKLVTSYNAPCAHMFQPELKIWSSFLLELLCCKKRLGHILKQKSMITPLQFPFLVLLTINKFRYKSDEIFLIRIDFIFNQSHSPIPKSPAFILKKI